MRFKTEEVLLILARQIKVQMIEKIIKELILKDNSEDRLAKFFS